MRGFAWGLVAGLTVAVGTLVAWPQAVPVLASVREQLQTQWQERWAARRPSPGEPGREAEPRPAPADPARVAVEAARSGEVPITLSGIGTVQAYNTISVRSRIDGEVTRILFREGQDVKAGEPLAIIDPRPLQAQLDQQEATRLKDQALLDGALLDLQRSEALVLKSFASQQQVDQQRALVAQYRAQIKSDEAQIAYARTQLAYTTIAAPLTGRTGMRLVDQGNYVRAGDAAAIVVVTQLQPISVVFTLPASAVARSRLSLGEVRAPVRVFAADERTLLDAGTVELVDNQVDPATGTIKLKASFPNAQLTLWPGNFVNGRITVDIRPQGVTIPLTALRHGPRGDFVFVALEGQKDGRKDGFHVATRSITPGQASGGRVLVEKGLKAGERVVTEGHYRLENGTPVTLVDKPEPPPRPAEPASRRPS
ncbi:membrane fusion protein, multidrug efflux system [Methylobacterium sp. 174MFSha1.1]|uniref:efflux RND transporter periplasmic adaptor subunit n=1 Tax=Methylobacterium sp. 174MFSha1.1 TaxID=1502749 RepID=UPI0008E562AF|nr:efflux RND transporter periplasmic adaptor subunit [Methylobacterium sp. 174MFSha1.1]SFU76246.1 membrane fusion protein, multidrug efflux system [Methylobacterium sp. 174MFSha1.1]